MIQLHRLEGFYWVAKTGGYARAARAFPYPITQPAVHQQVKKLEGELGTALFRREGRDRMLPTPAGRNLFEFVAPFFERLPGVVRGLRAGEFAGKLVVVAEPMLIRRLLPAWLRRLQRARPSIRIDLRERHEPNASALSRGECDLIVGYLPELGSGVAESRPVGRLSTFLVAPRDRTASRTRDSAGSIADRLASLAGEPFVAYPAGLRAHFLQLEALREHGITPERTISATSAETILGFVGAGLGYSLVPHLDSKGPKAPGVDAYPLTVAGSEFPVVAAWRGGEPKNPLVEAALDVAPTP